MLRYRQGLEVPVSVELQVTTATMTTREVAEFRFRRHPWDGDALEEAESAVVSRVGEHVAADAMSVAPAGCIALCFGAIVGEPMSSSEISWVVELAVKPSLQAEFAALTEEMVAAARAEPGTLIYERFLDAPGSRVIIYERYADSDSAIEHLEMFKRTFGARQNELATRQCFWLLGNASDKLLTLLRGIAEVEWFRSIGGFSTESLDSE